MRLLGSRPIETSNPLKNLGLKYDFLCFPGVWGLDSRAPNPTQPRLRLKEVSCLEDLCLRITNEVSTEIYPQSTSSCLCVRLFSQ